MSIVDLDFFEDQAAVNKQLKKNRHEKARNITPVLLEIILTTAFSPLFRVLIELSFWTGIPINSLLEMTYGDLASVEKGYISIYYTYGAVSKVPISQSIQQMLYPYIGQGGKWDYLFTHEDGSTWSVGFVTEQFSLLTNQAGIDCSIEDLKIA